MAESWLTLTNALLYNLLWNIWWELLVLWEGGGGGGWWWYPLATLSLSLLQLGFGVFWSNQPIRLVCGFLLELSVVTSQALCKWAIPSTPTSSPTLMEIWKSVVPMQKAWDLFLCCTPSYTHSRTPCQMMAWKLMDMIELYIPFFFFQTLPT